MQPTKILVIQNKRIGDVLISSVIANNLKKLFPKSYIAYFVYDYTAGVLEGNPNIDRIIAVNDRELKKIGKLLKMMRRIRKMDFDIIFDPYAKFQSRMICLSSRATMRIGHKKPHKKLKLPFYSHTIDLLKESSQPCGKAIEDRVNLVSSVFELAEPDYVPRIYLSDGEQSYNPVKNIKGPLVMLGVLGSTPQKSMPYEYIVQLIDYLTANYQVTVLFNYAPHQKAEALKIFEACRDKRQINTDIYEDSIRGFIKLMNHCDLLLANEGGSVHIAKALGKPTFTIYSPYVNKSFWSSFEDSPLHKSVHLLEEKPDLYNSFTLDERRRIEQNPEQLYRELTPEIIFEKLKPYLAQQLKDHRKE
jgi:heptosyltransferase-2